MFVKFALGMLGVIIASIAIFNVTTTRYFINNIDKLTFYGMNIAIMCVGVILAAYA